jgi:hypothetical protein
MKISHSGIQLYSTCPKAYQYRYKDRIHSLYRGSALFYGSAIDNALNYMLENLDKGVEDIVGETIAVFNKHWEQQDDKTFGLIDLPKYPYILYSKYDFDYELLEKEDWKELFSMAENPMDNKSRIDDLIKQGDFKDLSEEDKMFYNYCSWLSLRRKTPHLIRGYYEQLVPQIKRVIEVQKAVEITDECGNTLNGFIDFICELQDGSIVVADNKTSSVEYEEDSVSTSTQLAKYRFILNNVYGFNISKAAYFVLSKKLRRDKVCKSCGHKSTGSHKTCDAVVDGKRCHGEWDKKYVVDTQLVVQHIPDQFENMVMENTDEIIKCVTAEVFPRNLTNCITKYGSLCDFYNKCHGKDTSHLVVVEKKEAK